MLWRALKHVGPGCYVDIGAQSPDFDSVSRMFYDNGWRGIHVEPVDAYASLIRSRRPDELVLQVAVSDRPGRLRFFDIPETGLSTTDPAIAQTHQAAGFPVRELEVSSITLDAVLEQVADREVHWLKIDVEGAEAQIINGWAGGSRPWVVVIESTRPLSVELTHEQWEPSILEKGYAFAYFDGLNRFYVSEAHPELLGAFDRPPNVFDGFVLSPDSWLCRAARAQADAELDAIRGEHKLALDALQDEVGRRVSELTSERELVASLRREVEEQIASLKVEHQMVELLREEHAEARTHAESFRVELHRARADAERMRVAIYELEHSRSWRMTAPLRYVAWTARRLRQSPLQVAKDALAAGMRPVLRHRHLGPFVNFLVKCVPPLHVRLRRMAQNRGIIAPKEVPVPGAARSVGQVKYFDRVDGDASRLLSVRGRDLYEQLVANRESRGE